jgi:hypothetical protein
VKMKHKTAKTAFRFGPDSRNRLAESADAFAQRAEAALESFYYAFHNRDAGTLREVWSASPFGQLDNPGRLHPAWRGRHHWAVSEGHCQPFECSGHIR